jgi:hypothetical protein
MNRRSILKSIAVAPAAVALNAQQTAKPPATPVEEAPKIDASVPDAAAAPVACFFNAEQFASLNRLCEILAPSAGDLPGAKEAHTAEFLDFLIGESPKDRQSLYRTGLDRLNSDARTRFQKTFAALDSDQADGLLEPLRRPWTFEEPSDALARFLLAAKDDVAQATRSSYAYVTVAGKRSRGGSGVGMFWYPIY